jgi:hypothetical protein
MLDLGVFLPATVATCVALVHGTAWAQKALYLVAGWFGLVGPAVAAMAIAMYINNDPTGSAGNAVFMTVLGLAFAVLAGTVYRPLFGRPPGARSASETVVRARRQVDRGGGPMGIPTTGRRPRTTDGIARRSTRRSSTGL